MSDDLQELSETEQEVEQQPEQEVPKKKWEFTEERRENLRRAREKAAVLRKAMKEAQQPKPVKKTKLERQLDVMKAETPEVAPKPKVEPEAGELKKVEPKKVESKKLEPKKVEEDVQTPLKRSFAKQHRFYTL